MPRTSIAFVLSTLLLLFACAPAPEPAPWWTDLIGDWRAVLESPGGDLPFGLTLTYDESFTAVAHNGEEEAPFSSVDVTDDRRVILRFDWYDSQIVAQLAEDGRALAGEWTRTSAGGDISRLPFRAERDSEGRFLGTLRAGLEPVPVDTVPMVLGHWSVVFTDEDGSEPARAELEQDGDQVTGTFLTPTGDYRFLEGSYQDGHLRLSTFDGAHAFLFHARAQADGSLTGDFWSRDTYHATWVATPMDPSEAVLPDPWQLASVTNEEGRFRFAFPDLEGNAVDQDDPRFQNKVVVINIFGSWCPNCNDEAPLLANWYERFRDRGLEIVGLAYEFTGDTERDRQQVRRFVDRHGLGYPMLLAGTSDKADAAATLPDLDRVVAYPTTIFVGRDGTVRKVHSGFSGPGTGAHHEALVTELESVLEMLLDEPATS